MSEKPTSKREDTKKQNRELILKAGQQVFSEIGLDACNVRDIIRASGLSTGTFYNYFQSKEEVFDVLLDEIILDIHNQARDIWLRALQVTDADKMAVAFREFFLIFQSNPDYLKFFLKNQQYVRQLRYNGKLSNLLGSLEEDLESAIRSKRLPPFPVHLATLVLFGAVFEVLAEIISRPKEFQLEETSKQMASFFKGGILSLSLSTGTDQITGILSQFANIPVHLVETFLKNPLIQSNQK